MIPSKTASGNHHPFDVTCESIGARVICKILPVIFLALTYTGPAYSLGQPKYVESFYRRDSFPICQGTSVATIYVDVKDHAGVVRAANDLQADISRVTDQKPVFTNDERSLPANVIIVGTIGKSSVIDHLIRQKKIDISSITGKWESFLLQVVQKPMPGVARALVIAGSDKRGTIYGIYDLSEQIGVSPWYWWADVAVQHKNAVFVKAGKYVQGPPAVKYRGIFLNDEAPSLSGWVHEKFGNYNHQFYEKVFELLLRLKANYLWPAMWNNAFNEDDPLNPKLADEYGIVMGTSHHEPMLRAQQEWKRHGKREWNYATNSDVLRQFWTEGIERNKNYESIVTLGMRGDGDLPMVEGGDMAANVALLETIVTDQRKIIAGHINPDLSAVPQNWALYKEVQEYYEKGMRVPDDVTLLWCDDNWGNIRRLPTEEERKRRGGAGIYYHFDYVGDPRSYKWLNTIPITKVWEQMNLAYNYGANRIWIVNVGDLKPMEFPVEFFLHLAWNPSKWPKNSVAEFTKLWAEREFSPQYAADIAEIVSRYTKYNGWRKPELLEPETFSLVNYQEADRVLAGWKSITQKAQQIYASLPENQRDAFFELVLYPARASAQVAEMYIAAGKNRLGAGQGRASANYYAAQARALFQADANLSDQYNHRVAHGKWNHIMDQPHIGYTTWHDPPTNVMPVLAEANVPIRASLGVAVEASELSWPNSQAQPSLPVFDVFNQQSRFIDVFNRGQNAFEFAATASDPWILLSATHGTLGQDQRIWVSVDWKKAPTGTRTGSVRVTGAGSAPIVINIPIFNPEGPPRTSLKGFVESNGYVSMEAEHYAKKTDANHAKWEKLDDYGRTLSSMTVFPVTAQSAAPPQNSPCLEYEMYVFDSGKVQVEAILAPTLNFVPGRGLRYAVSFDNQPPQIVDALAQNSPQDWATSVKDSVRKSDSAHTLDKPGYHTLKFWMVDPGLVLQKLVVNFGGVKPSYFGPPESYCGACAASNVANPAQ